MQLAVFDIGGTGIQGAIMDTTTQSLSQRVSFKTPRENISLVPSIIADCLDNEFKDINISGIALSSAGLVDKQARIVGKGSFFYEGFGKTIVLDLEKRFNVPVSLENDGNCAALAELWSGNGKGCQSLVSIVIGTAIGGAIVHDGKILRGFNNLAGEFGFILYEQYGGLYNIWSEEGSTQSIVKLFQVAYPNDAEAMDGEKLFALEAAGHLGAHQFIEKFITLLAEQCYNLQYIIDPEKILIGGGISLAPNLIQRLTDKVALIARSKRQTVVVPVIDHCKFGNEANLIGAAYDWLVENNKI